MRKVAVLGAGVCIPSTKEMSEPVLEEMEIFGFSFKKEIIIL